VSDLSNIDQRLITSKTIERLERIDHKFQVIKIESVDHQMVSERQLCCKGKNDLYASFTSMQIRFFRVFHSFSERKRPKNLFFSLRFFVSLPSLTALISSSFLKSRAMEIHNGG
jgi:hypothetical protein